MKIDVDTGVFTDKSYELLALGGFEDSPLKGVAKKVDGALEGELSEIIRSGEFKGKAKQVSILHTHDRIKIRRVLLVGLGRREELNLDAVRTASGKTALTVREIGLSSYATTLLEASGRLPIWRVVEGLVNGCELALYRFSKYKVPEPGLKEVERVTIFVEEAEHLQDAVKAVETAEIIDRGVTLARNLSNTPSNDCTPTDIAERAQEISRENGLKCTVLGREEMERLGMGGMLGVSRGSQQPPKLVILEYNGGGGGGKPIVLVGKGITFDSGGISIKPAEKMEEMKYDKSGATSVIAILQTAAQLKLPLNLVGIMPLTENLPSGSAYKPGDVLRMYGGKTVEVISTDAEGRLILADALAYASTYHPQAVIDLATLTGACVIALGNLASGLFGNDEGLKKKILEAGEETGERVWELPLWKEYQEQLKSEVADLKNVGGKPAGAITGARFLGNFVDYPWAHLDIAGTAWIQNGMPDRTYIPKGATGVGVRLLIEVLRKWRGSV